MTGKYRTISLDPEIKAPNRYVYRDTAGKRARGMLGGFIGLAIGAASEGPGFRRFDAAASKKPIDIRALVRRHIQAALQTAGFLQLVTANAETTLRIQIHAYGVAPVSGRQLGGVISARATLTGKNGQTIWQKDEWGNSNTSAMLTDIEQNPALWPKMAEEAADALARKLILYTAATQRTISPTNM
ncbi:MAG: LPS assembly lipoprotein LptE [Chthoniobacterales bacterium]